MKGLRHMAYERCQGPSDESLNLVMLGPGRRYTCPRPATTISARTILKPAKRLVRGVLVEVIGAEEQAVARPLSANVMGHLAQNRRQALDSGLFFVDSYPYPEPCRLTLSLEAS